ncbi:DUF1338 domain-containing protein [Mucilaginibacter daejeonensis]|uniref:DUF1338 domain-containing protein n=1 Tax=Mucilaginibacter daejeonensis TaxID=398049 RepID=UPI001D17A3D9|nr:DUF1338 domain-containing protein [Mucilaginibacter daejeonensis]UEG55283.1 DUF1338 domain-containing protein [Mucilaginibacter daejeonensis]
MNFDQGTPLDIFLNMLFDRYQAKVPAVKRITDAMIAQGIVREQHEIVNDHIAFRALGVPNLGIASFEKIFLHHGYTKRDHYYFEAKKLNAYWYAPPAERYPRIFMSELMVDELSPEVQSIIHRYTDHITTDPVDQLDLNDGEAIGEFFHRSLWQLPTRSDYLTLLNESEYAAWVIYNRYYLNHYTISVHALKDGYDTIQRFDDFVEGLGIKLNDAGGKIKVSADGLLKQSSTVAEMQEATFAEGDTMSIAGSYVEFAERLSLPQFSDVPAEALTAAQRREGFETTNADKIFESTYTEQTRS